jgi:hypothetical protein
MPILLIISSAVLFSCLHELNQWAFSFLSFNDHISPIYLPGFIRVLNILILGPVNGSIATLLGGLFLLPFQFNLNAVEVVNLFCSASGPLLAIWIFKLSFTREIKLTSSKDLLVLSAIYSLCNALMHHFAWSLLDPNALSLPSQFFEMVLGDLTGTVLGAVILKLLIKIPFIHKKIE